MSVDYFYFFDRLNTGIPSIAKPESNSPSISELPDKNNPVYNFYSAFVTDLQKVTALEMAQSQPFISLCSLDQNGDILTNFNKEFFIKPLDMASLSKENRYGDRPLMSLKSVRLSSDLAAGGGLISWTKAMLSLTIHKPDLIGSTALKNLLFTGTALRLVYGWNSSNELMNEKDILLISVSSYNISFNTQGEAELTLEGLTHTENLANIFVGDEATEVPNSEGLYEREKITKEFVSYANVIRFRPTAQGQRSVKVIQAMTQKYKQVIERASDKVRKNFNDYSNLLKKQKKSNSNWFPDVKKKAEGLTTVGSEYVTVHDVVGILCGKTLESLGNTILSNKNFRVVYGAFNKNAGPFASKSIADFPIHWNSFERILKENNESGEVVPTLQGIFDIICLDFLGQQFYWDNFLDKDKKEDIDYPKITFHISSHFLGDNEVIQLSLIDINKDVPITQKVLLDKNVQFVTQDEQEKAVVGSSGIPIVRFGHANSFIKNINISHQNDEYIKALMINRAGVSSVTSARQPFVTLNTTPDQPTQGLQLPLRGDMEMLGHVNWLPGRFFYISSGIFFLDGVYSILSVEHELDSSQFKTRISFLMH